MCTPENHAQQNPYPPDGSLDITPISEAEEFPLPSGSTLPDGTLVSTEIVIHTPDGDFINYR